MSRNRVLGAPYAQLVTTSAVTTDPEIDAYLIDAVPLTITLDPNAFSGDQVLIQDITNASFVQGALPSSADAWITAGYTTHGASSYSFDQTVSFTRGNGDNPANWQVGLSVTASDSPVTLTWTSLKLEYQTY